MGDSIQFTITLNEPTETNGRIVAIRVLNKTKNLWCSWDRNIDDPNSALVITSDQAALSFTAGTEFEIHVYIKNFGDPGMVQGFIQNLNTQEVIGSNSAQLDTSFSMEVSAITAGITEDTTFEISVTDSWTR